jgi:hypothetical protein
MIKKVIFVSLYGMQFKRDLIVADRVVIRISLVMNHVLPDF